MTVRQGAMPDPTEGQDASPQEGQDLLREMVQEDLAASHVTEVGPTS